MFQSFVAILYTEDFIVVGYFISNAKKIKTKIVAFFVTYYNIDTLKYVDGLIISSEKIQLI